MSNKPIAYIFHGHCDLPTITDPYMGMMVLPNRSMHVRQGDSAVTRMSLQECGIAMDDDFFQEGFVRVDIMSAGEFARLNGYADKLAALGLQRTELRHVDYEQAHELFENGLTENLDRKQRAFCPLYGLSTRWNPMELHNQEMAFHLCLADHTDTIDKVIRQIKQKDSEVVSASSKIQ
jgi:hypothetical protein